MDTTRNTHNVGFSHTNKEGAWHNALLLAYDTKDYIIKIILDEMIRKLGAYQAFSVTIRSAVDR